MGVQTVNWVRLPDSGEGVLLVLSSPLANLLKAWASEGWSAVKCWDSNSMGTKGDVKEGSKLTPMGSFDVGQGGCQLQT